MRGDAISQTIARQGPRALGRKGFLPGLVATGPPPGRRAGLGAIAWRVVRRARAATPGRCAPRTLDAAGYAAKWIRHTERDSPEQFPSPLREVDRLLRARGNRGGERQALITIRRRSGTANWFRAPTTRPRRCSARRARASLLGFCPARLPRDRAERRSPAGRAVPRFSGRVCLQQRYGPGSEGWCLAESELRTPPRLASTREASTPMRSNCWPGAMAGGRWVSCCGRRRRRSGRTRTPLAPACLDVVRRLVERGFLIPNALLPPTSAGA